MRALILAGSPTAPDVRMTQIERPIAQPGRLLVEPIAVGVTKMEPHWKPNWLKRDGTARQGPVVLGNEFSGRIVEVGSGVERP